MAENDIYDSKTRYERFKGNLKMLLVPPEKRKWPYGNNCKYYCRNKVNLKCFERIFDSFEAKDISYIRRVRLCGVLSIIVNATNKPLKEIDKEGDRDEINKIIAFMHKNYKSINSKSDFIKDIKCLWKQLFPEKDEKGRIDETLTPYAVRHLSRKMDKSKEKRRKDKLTFEEFENLVQFFSKDAQMQFYLVFANESLVRPQEACYIRLSGIELHDNYAKIYLSEHGKEGVNGFLRCIDSFPYLVKWLEKHPYRNNKDSFLFVLEGSKNNGEQQKPHNFNKKMRYACKKLAIDKKITAYSLKRNGVSFKRLAGYSDVEIQHIARWSSTKQLKTYDLTEADDTFKIALMRKGLVKADKKHEALMPELKKCLFCGKQNSFTAVACQNCKRPLDRKDIETQEKNKGTEIKSLKSQLEELKSVVMQLAKSEIKAGPKNVIQSL